MAVCLVILVPLFSILFYAQKQHTVQCTKTTTQMSFRALENWTKNKLLIHVFSTFSCRTRTGDFHVFDGKLVIVSQFFTGNDSSQGENDDVFLAKNVHDFRVTIGLQGENHCFEIQ